MSNTPNSLDTARLKRAFVWGAVLAVGGILAFVIIWLALPFVQFTARVLIALCVPPLLFALIIGGYALVTRRKS